MFSLKAPRYECLQAYLQTLTQRTCNLCSSLVHLYDTYSMIDWGRMPHICDYKQTTAPEWHPMVSAFQTIRSILPKTYSNLEACFPISFSSLDCTLSANLKMKFKTHGKFYSQKFKQAQMRSSENAQRNL